MAPLVRRSWSPCGQTPVLHQRSRSHRKVSVIAALCVSPARDWVYLYFRLYPDANITAPLIVAFLRQLHSQLHPDPHGPDLGSAQRPSGQARQPVPGR